MSFKMTFNLAGVQPSNSIKRDLVTGFYKCKITKMEGKNPIYEDGEISGYKRGMWLFTVVEEGDYNGCTAIHSMNTPSSPSDWIATLWVDSLMSCGYSIDDIVDMPVYDDTVYVGRECYISFIAKEDNGGQYSKVKFIKSEEDFLVLKERGVSKSKKKQPVVSTSNASPRIEVSAPPQPKNLNSLIDGIGDIGF